MILQKHILLAILTIMFSCELSQKSSRKSLNLNQVIVAGDSIQEEKWFYSLEEALKNPAKVQFLSLRDQKYKEFPAEIFQFVNLLELDLSVNSLEVIPVEIGSLKKIRYLSFSYGTIKEISASIGELENLEELSLLDNRVKNIPKEIGKLKKLKVLNLSLNPLEDLPEEIFELTNLKELIIDPPFLEESNFTASQQQRIKKKLPNCKVYFGYREN